jgi:hypothetical protein
MSDVLGQLNGGYVRGHVERMEKSDQDMDLLFAVVYLMTLFSNIDYIA